MTVHDVTASVIAYGSLMLVHATALALITFVLSRTVLRRCRPSIHVWLWLIVLVKFVCPPIFPGDVTLSGWLANAWPAVVSAVQMESDSRMDFDAPVAAGPPASISAVAAPASQMGRWGWREVLVAAYLAGLMVAVGRWGIARRRHRHLLARIRPAPQRIVEYVASLGRRIGLLSRVCVRLTTDDSGPWVSGFWQPVLVLPMNLLRPTDGRSRDAIILHELAHIRRGDLLVRGIENLLRVVFFFWPPVWWVCRRIERYSEMACDQWALLASRIAPDVYADSLLRMARRRLNRGFDLTAAVALISNGRTLEERITMILNSQSMAPRYRWQIAAIMVAWGLFALAGGATATPQDKPDDRPVPHSGQPRPGGPPNIDMDQPVAPERARQLLEQYGEEGIDANADGVLTRREVMDFYRKKGLPMGGRPGGPGPGPGGPPDERRFAGRPGEGPADMILFFERFLRIESGNIDRERLLEQHPAADADKDGKLSDEELARALDFARDLALRRLLQIAPDADADKNGRLSDEEVATFKERTLARLSQRILYSDAKADKDGDGKLSAEEFLAFRDEQRARQRQMMLERHPEADTDRDGKLSDAEMRALEQKMREQWSRDRGPENGPRRPLPGERQDEGQRPPDDRPGEPPRPRP